MSSLSKTTLRAIAKADPVIGFANDDPAFVFISAAGGEIQLSQDGSAWWMRWDRTHAVSDECELDAPPTDNPADLAEWISEQARQLDEQYYGSSK